MKKKFGTYTEASAAFVFLVVGFNDPFLVRQEAVKQEDSGGTRDSVEQALQRGMTVEIHAAWQAGDGFHPFEGWPIGQISEWITKQHGFGVGDGFHSGDVTDDFSFALDDSGVADSQTVEEIHQDHDDEEHEGQ